METVDDASDTVGDAFGNLSPFGHFSIAVRTAFGRRSEGFLSDLDNFRVLTFFSFRPEVEHRRPEDSRRRSDGIRRLQSSTGRRRVVDCSRCIRIGNILSVFGLRWEENQKNVEIRQKNFKNRQKQSKKVKNRPNTIRTPSERRPNGFDGCGNWMDFDPFLQYIFYIIYIIYIFYIL
jgi:hypothetical protein